MLELDQIANTTITIKEATERVEVFLDLGDHLPTPEQVAACRIVVHRSTLKVLPTGEILSKQFGTSRIERTIGEFLSEIDHPVTLAAIIALADTWAAEDKAAADEALENG